MLAPLRSQARNSMYVPSFTQPQTAAPESAAKSETPEPQAQEAAAAIKLGGKQRQR